MSNPFRQTLPILVANAMLLAPVAQTLKDAGLPIPTHKQLNRVNNMNLKCDNKFNTLR